MSAFAVRLLTRRYTTTSSTGASVALRSSRQQPLLTFVQRQITGDTDVTICVTINLVEDAQLRSRSGPGRAVRERRSRAIRECLSRCR